jgi:CubicO group peptidase (beta-lactamase class C family)
MQNLKYFLIVFLLFGQAISFMLIDEVVDMVVTNISSLQNADFAIEHEDLEFFLGMGAKIRQNGIEKSVFSGKVNWVDSPCKSKTFSENTLFNIASVTKNFAIAALLRLIDDKPQYFPNELNTKLSFYLPFLNTTYKGWKFMEILPKRKYFDNITLINLVQHTAGFGGFMIDNVNENIHEIVKGRSEDDLMTMEDDSYASYGKFFYSNIGYHLIGMVMKSVTNDSFSNLVKKYVLNPLNLKNTYTSIELENTANSINLKYPNSCKDVSQSYSFYYNKLQPNKAFKLDTSIGGMYSTFDDLLSFSYNYFRDDENAFFSANSRKLRDTTPVEMDKDSKYGVGFIIYSNGDKGHSGDDMGSTVRAVYNPNLNMTKAIIITSETVTLEIADVILAKGRKKSGASKENLTDIKKRFEIIKELRCNYTVDQIVSMAKLARKNSKIFYLLYKLSLWAKNPTCC